MGFEAYRVAVRLSLINGVSTGLIAMMGQFRTLDKTINSARASTTLLEREMGRIKKLGLVGGAMAGVGIGVLAMFKGPLEEAKKFDQAVGKFKLFGMSDALNSEAVRFAKGMNVIGTSYTDNMKLMTEAQGVFRESGMIGPAALEGAKLATPMLAKIQFASAGLDDESKAKMHTQSLAMLRFVEMRGGLKDAATFNNIADAGWKAIQSSGGNVNFEQLRQFMARGGVAAQGLSDVALYGKLEPVIGELKGSTAGNAWMTSYNRLVGGVKIPNQVAHLLTENGIWDKSKVEWNSMGGIKKFNGNPLKDMATFSSDPAEFYEKNIIPMYAKMNKGKGLDLAERGRENTMIFGRTGGMMFSLIDRQLATIHKSTEAWAKAMGVDASNKVAMATLAGKEVALAANWKKFQLVLGETILPMAIKAVEGLSSALQGFTAFAKANPAIVKVLTVSIVGLAGAMAFGGSVILLTAGFRALGLALAFSKIGGVAGIVGIGSKFIGLGGSLLGLVSPIGIAVLAIGTLAAAFYAFRKMSQGEVDAAKTGGGVKLTADTLARSKAMGWEPPKVGIQSVAPVQSASASNRWSRPLTSGVANVQSVAPARNQTIQVSSQVNLDGRKVGEAVTTHIVKEANRPFSGSSFFDGSMAMPPVAFGG